MHDWGSWGMEVTGVWGGCPASFCHVTMSSGTLSLGFFRLIHISRVPTIFISQILSVKKKPNKKQVNSFCICLLNQNWNFKRERVETFTSGCFWTGSCGEWLMGQVFFDSEASRECSPVPSPQPTLLLFLFLLESLARLRPFRLCSSSSIWERAHGHN